MRSPNVLIAGLVAVAIGGASRVAVAAPFKVFMVSSTAPDHLAMTAAAKTALATMGQANDFSVDATTDTTLINDDNLAGYQVFLQMHLAPFEVTLEQRLAVEHFVQQGKGWVGIHGAGLIIPSSYVKRNYPNWDFYSQLLGGITYVIHPALQNGTLLLEDRTHPATRNLPASFQIRDEWYEWDKSPRAGVRVLAKADERTYTQVTPMGDHPMIWSCEAFQRAIYIGVGHDASDWNNANFATLVRDALLWASTGTVAPLPAVDGGRDASSIDAGFRDGSVEANPGGGGSGSAGGSGSGGEAGASGGEAGSGSGAGGVATGAAGATGSAGTANVGSAGSRGASSSGAAGATDAGGCACRLGRAASADDAAGLLLVAVVTWLKRRRSA